MLDDNVHSRATDTDPGNDLEIIDRCPMCKSSECHVAADRAIDLNYGRDDGQFSFLRCQACRSVWLRERPVGARLGRAYQGYYTHADPDNGDHHGSLKSMIRNAYIRSRYGRGPGVAARAMTAVAGLAGKNFQGIDRLYRFAPKAPAKVLDYGCGSGAYLLRLWPLGHELQGLEYDPQLIGGLAEHGIPVGDVSQIDDHHWHDEFDHISLAHVLEHVPDPHALLERLFRWLKPGGTLFVELPNGGSLGLDIFGRQWRCLETPRHFVMPSRQAMVEAFLKAGFVSPQQYVDQTIRAVMWRNSLATCPDEERPAAAAAVAAAGAQTPDNTEYLTFVATKPGAR